MTSPRPALAALATVLLLGACAGSTEQPGYTTVHIETTPVDGDCELKGKGFMLATKTPTDVVVPIAAAPMTIICSKIGYRGEGVLSSKYDPWAPGSVGTLGLGYLIDKDSPSVRSLPATVQVAMTYTEAGTPADAASMDKAKAMEAAASGDGKTGMAEMKTGETAKPMANARMAPKGGMAPQTETAKTSDALPMPADKAMAKDGLPAPAPAAASKKMPAGAKPEAMPAPLAAKPAPAKLVMRDTLRVHLTSFRQKALAERSWKNLTKEYPQLLGGLWPSYDQVDVGGGKGLYYRLYAGPLPDAKAARTLCAELRKKNVYCRTVGQGGK